MDEVPSCPLAGFRVYLGQFFLRPIFPPAWPPPSTFRRSQPAHLFSDRVPLSGDSSLRPFLLSRVLPAVHSRLPRTLE